MTKTFCDRCKTEIKNRNTIHRFDFQGGEWDGELCDDCYKAFESFMKMEDNMYHTRDIPNNHGIERMTFGSK